MDLVINEVPPQKSNIDTQQFPFFKGPVTLLFKPSFWGPLPPLDFRGMCRTHISRGELTSDRQDPFAEEDFEGHAQLTAIVGDKAPFQIDSDELTKNTLVNCCL